MADPAIVTDGEAYATGTGNVTATFGNSHTATAGNLLLAIVGLASTSAITTPTDWTLHPSFPHTSSGANGQTDVYIKEAVGGETGITVVNPGSSRLSVQVIEVDSCDAAGIVAGTVSLTVATNEDTGDVTSLALTSIDPASTLGCLMVGAVFTKNGATGGTEAFDNSYTLIRANSTGRYLMGTRTITNPGSTTTTGSWASVRDPMGIHLAIPGEGGTDATAAPAAVAGTTAVGDDVEQTGSTADPDAVAGTTDIPTPTVDTSTPATPTPATIAGSVAVGDDVEQTGSVATPSTIQAPVSVGDDVEQTGSTVTPDTVSADTVIPPPVQDSTVTPDTISAEATIDALEGEIDETPTPSAVAGTTDIPAPAVAAGLTQTPDSPDATTSIPTPTIQTGQIVTPATVAGDTDIETPTITIGTFATPTPSAVAGTTSVPTPTVTTSTLGALGSCELSVSSATCRLSATLAASCELSVQVASIQLVGV